MKKVLSFALFLFLGVFTLQAQTLEELKTKKADLEAKQAAEQAKADAFKGEIADLSSQIEILSGWQKGLGGVVGLNFNDANKWASNANPNSSSSNLAIALSGFATKTTDKSFWRNSGNINLGWQGLKTDVIDSKFLQDRVTDLFTISSLYGYKLNQDIAVSALGDFNSSVFNFLSPGSLDFGAGVTWTPHQIPNLYVVLHPLTYHIAFPGNGSPAETTSGLGTKIKAEYAKDFGKVSWTSSLGGFIPYGGKKLGEDSVERSLAEYTWINSLSFKVLKDIGVGITYGIRKTDYESAGDLQSFSTVGLSYGF